MNILVCDDRADTWESLEAYLRLVGCAAAHAGNGREALALLNEGAFDAVVADHLMPGMTGLELLRAMRAGRRFAEMPVALISGLPEEDVLPIREEALNLGKVRHFMKPAEPAEVLAWLKETVSPRQSATRP